MIRRAPLPRPESGFILPGVVMFIFVLTIIGLSLFSLSSYEAQFMYRTLDQTQAFYDASGAIDRARFILASTKDLGRVPGMVGSGGITFAQAQQGNKTSGLVDWTSSDSVLIRVRVEKNGVARELQAAFYPHSNPYDNLFSISALNRGLFNSKTTNNGAPNEHVFLTGSVWQTYSGQNPPPGYDWYENIYDTGNNNTFQVNLSPVPAPQVAAFFTGHPTNNPPVWQNGIGLNHATLDAGPPGTIKLFKTGKTQPPYSQNIETGNDIDLDVRGTAIWMFDAAFRTTKKLTIHRFPGATGAPTEMLVLVAKKSSDPANGDDTGTDDIGFIFKGGIDSPDGVPVIIVSDGYVAIGDQDDATSNKMSIAWLSIYANFVWIHGPDQAPGAFTFAHLEGVNTNAETNLQNLLDGGLLPNASSKRRQLTFIPGTWQEIGN